LTAVAIGYQLKRVSMIRPLLAIALCLAPLGAVAQNLTLAALFEVACIAPFEGFFADTEPELRNLGFEIYPSDSYAEFAHPATGISGAYSYDAEDLFCMVHDPRANTEDASRAAQVLLGNYYDRTPQLVPAGAGLIAWGVPYGTCCYLTAIVADRSPSDIREGAMLTLLVKDK